MENRETERTVELIRKLLALAGNNPSREEAEAALRKAQILALENGVTIESIDCDSNESPELTEVHCDQGNRASVPHWMRILSATVASNFRVTSLVTGSGRNSRLSLFGAKEDVEACRPVVSFVFSYFENSWKDFRLGLVTGKPELKGHRELWTPLRKDYLIGFTSGIEEVFRQNVEERGLVVTQHPSIDEALDDMGVTSRELDIKGALGSRAAQIRGYRDGKAASVHKSIADERVSA